MYSKSYVRNLFLFLVVFILFAMSGCANSTKTVDGKASGGFAVKDGKMLHIKEVLEHYDSLGQPVPQYYELWLADKKGFCVELEKSGKEIRGMLDIDGKHVAYDPKTKAGVKYDVIQIFTLDFKTLKASYSKVVQADDQQYAGRSCAIYLLENDGGDEWMKIYVDKETGYVLFCDAPLFRLRTALLEVLPVDDKLFTAPSDIIFK